MTKTGYWEKIVAFDPTLPPIFPVYDTTGRNALSVGSGSGIFNSDTQQIEINLSGIWTGTSIPVGRVKTISELQALTARPNVVFVESQTSSGLGINVANDGGGGWFYWVPGGSAPADNVVVVNPTGTPLGRYVLGTVPQRLTGAQRDAISSPPEGLLVYNSTTHVYNYYNGGSWLPVSSTNAGAISAGILLADFGGTGVNNAGSTLILSGGALHLAGAGGATLNYGPGGTLGTNAFTSTTFAPAASPSFTGTLTGPDGGTWTSSGLTAKAFIPSNSTIPSAGMFLPAVNTLGFAVSGAESFRIQSNGFLQLGGAAGSSTTALSIQNPTGPTGTQSGIGDIQTIGSSTTTAFNTFYSTPQTAASAFTLTTLRHFYVLQGTIGAGSAVTNQYGFNVDPNMTGATNNYGFYSGLNSASNVWAFYAGGTANSFFAGPLLAAGQITGFSNTAIPAGGTTGSGITLSSVANYGIFFGSGSPNLSAARGSLYLRSDGAPYYNTNGTTGWTPIASLNSPVLVTPTLGVATATSINGLTITTTTGTLTVTGSKVLTISNSLTLAGTDGSTLNIGTGGTLGGAALQNIGTSGANVPLLSTANTWSLTQKITYATTTAQGFEAWISGDTFGRVALGTNSTDVSRVSFGPGNAARDVFLERSGVATLRIGTVDGAAPVAQTIGVQNVVAGTSNTAGANLTINGSIGTGTGLGGSIVYQVAPAGGSGTAQNPLVPVLTLDATKTATFGGSIVSTAGTIQYMGVATGLVNVMAVAPSPAITAYATGAIYLVQANITNTTTTPTLNINGLGAKTIVKRAATALAAGDYLANMMCMFIYDGTNMELLNPVVN